MKDVKEAVPESLEVFLSEHIIKEKHDTLLELWQ